LYKIKITGAICCPCSKTIHNRNPLLSTVLQCPFL
jgi:hypothetical protein